MKLFPLYLLAIIISCSSSPKHPALNTSIVNANTIDTTKEIAFEIKPVSDKDTLAFYMQFPNLTSDSINALKVHQLIWRIKNVRSTAIFLRDKNIKTFTLIDKQPSNKMDCYELSLNQFLGFHYVRMDTYRVWLSINKIEKLNNLTDKWEKVKT